MLHRAVAAAADEEFFYFDGRHHSEAQVVEVFLAFVPALNITPLSGQVGRPIDPQSALALLFFIASNRRRAFAPFGVFSDERLPIVECNDTVATRMAAALLSFAVSSKSVDSVHDAVMLALPAPKMRELEFAASAALPTGNRYAIDHFGYGTNSKMMVGFNGRPWYERNNSNGASYSDLANHLCTWEPYPSLAQAQVRGVLTGYSGGQRGARQPRRQEPCARPPGTLVEAAAVRRRLGPVHTTQAGCVV